MIINQKQLKTYKKACQLSCQILKKLVNAIKPDIYPDEINQLAGKICQKHNVKPAFLGVGDPPFPANLCVSVNQFVVHTVPSKTKKLKIGDLVKLDFGIVYNDLYTDHCVTVAVKKISKKNRLLVKATQKAVQAAIPLAITGNTVGDLGHIMHATAKAHNFDVLKQYTGHGIGKTLHDPPTIPAHGQPKTGDKLKKNQLICLEAQLVEKSDQVMVDSDGWSVKTIDNGMTAMFEYMVVVKNQKPLVLTPTFDWPIVV